MYDVYVHVVYVYACVCACGMWCLWCVCGMCVHMVSVCMWCIYQYLYSVYVCLCVWMWYVSVFGMCMHMVCGIYVYDLWVYVCVHVLSLRVVCAVWCCVCDDNVCFGEGFGCHVVDRTCYGMLHLGLFHFTE